MIVKIFKNKGAGSATASVNYLIGKHGDRENSRVIKGNIELTKQLAESLDFKNRYTVGVLSFEEKNIDESHKREIMDSFEQTLFTGLEQDQYSIAWVEHTDKDRLELNFFVANVELSTGKRLQPYFDKVDRGLVNAWKDVTNYDYQLTDPNDPSKKLDIKPNKDLPKTKKELKNAVHAYLMQQIGLGTIKDRKDVLRALESDLELNIARTTKQSISIKDPDGGQNIRFKGEIYEQDFRVTENYTAENDKASREYQRTRADEIERTRTELFSRLETKRNYMAERYQPSRQKDKQFGNQSIYERHSDRGFNHADDRVSSRQPMALQEISNDGRRIRTDTTAHRTNATGSQNFEQSGNWRERRQVLYREQSQESRNLQISTRQSSADLSNQVELNHAQRLHEQLQQFARRIRATVERIASIGEQAEHTDRVIVRSKSRIDDTERAVTSHHNEIDKRKQNVLGTYREIEQREQAFNEIRQDYDLSR